MEFHIDDFSKICRENSSLIKIWKKNGYFTWRPMYIYNNISLNFFRMINVPDKVVENVKTHILYSIKCFFFPFLSFFRKSFRLWDDVVNYGRASQTTGDNIMGRRKDANCLLDNQGKLYRHTIAVCNIDCFSMVTVITRMRLNVTLYVHCLSCYFWFVTLFCLLSTLFSETLMRNYSLVSSATGHRLDRF